MSGPGAPLGGRPSVEFARPGRDTVAWLLKAIRHAQAADPFARVTLVVPSIDVGRELQLALGAAGGYLNVAYLRLSEVAEAITGTPSSDTGRAPVPPRRTLGRTAQLSAIRAALEVTARDHPSIRETRAHQSLHQALHALFGDLRARGGDRVRPGRPTATFRAAIATYRAYREVTNDWVDPVDLAEAAIDVLATGGRDGARAVATLGSLLVVAPVRLDHVDARLLAVVAAHVPVRLVLPQFGDQLRRASDVNAASGMPVGLGDIPATRMARAVMDVGGGVVLARPAAPDETSLLSDLRVIRAPDPAEEVREVVRLVLAGAEREDPADRIPLHRVAILYRDRDPYARLIEETLTLAGVPHLSLGGTSLAETRPGRAFCRLLHLRDHDLARGAVLAWAEASPVVDPGDGLGLVEIDPARWDWVTREASVVRGSDQWRARLAAFADRREGDAARSPDHFATAKDARADAATARDVARVVACLDRRLEAPAGGWRAGATWARDLLRDFVGDPAATPHSPSPHGSPAGGAYADSDGGGVLVSPFPRREGGWGVRPYADSDGARNDAEREALREIAAVIERLPDDNPFDGSGGAAQLPSVLIAALEGRPFGRARFGSGIVTGQVDRVPPVPFDVIAIVGMIEGHFPPPAGADPFFPDPDDDPLGRREARSAAERAAFLGAIALADGGTVILGTADTLGGRDAYPARWLLELAGVRLGRPIKFARDLRALDARQAPWLRHVVSVQDGARRTDDGASTPLDVEDRRLGDLARWTGGQGAAPRSAHAHPLAHASGRDVHARHASAASAARHRALATAGPAAFTAWDGNVEEVAQSSTSLARMLAGPLSATRFEAWATCPFRSLLRDTMSVPPTRVPTDTWGLDPIARGTLVHEILEAWHRDVPDPGGRERDRRLEDADLTRLDDLVIQAFDTLRARGGAGYDVVWVAIRDRLRSELRTFAKADDERRAESGLVPTLFEHAYGTRSARRLPDPEGPQAPLATSAGRDDDRQTWGEAIVTLPDRRPISFRGRIDRVDISAGGTMAEVIDYKTGSVDRFKKVKDDPVLAGTAIQLALYRHAAIQALGVGTSVAASFRFPSGKDAGAVIPVAADDPRVGARLVEVVGIVADGISAGAFPQEPGPDGENCRTCDYRRACGANLDLVRERTVLDGAGAIHARLDPSLALPGAPESEGPEREGPSEEAG